MENQKHCDTDHALAEMRLLIEGAVKSRSELRLSLGGTEYYVEKSEILFFETSDSKVYAHTCNGMYAAPYKLFELESLLPSCFVRISKSSIANVYRIRSLRRELTGNGEIAFKGCDKKADFSRGYYKLLYQKIDEMRFEIFFLPLAQPFYTFLLLRI